MSCALRNRLLASSVALGMVCGAGAGAGSRADAKELTTVSAPFEERFATRLDRKLWYVSDGWRNGAHQNCTWSQRAISVLPGSGLKLHYLPPSAATPEPLCGEIQSRQWFLHGTFEARIRADQGGSGLNAAFFTFTGPVHDQPHDEIDFEILRREPGLVWLNRYVAGNDFGAGEEYRYAPAAPADLPEGFHDYAFTWEPGRLRWYVDGTLAREVTRGVPDHPMKVYFSLWGSDSFPGWMGRFEMPAQGVAMTVTRFRYTPPGQGCSFDGSILCR